MHHLDDCLQRVASAYFGGDRLALLFDFDGTLSSLVTHPDLATCADATQEVLSALSELPRVTVGIISGRALADLKTKVCLPGLAYAGTCGLEIEHAGRVIENFNAKRQAPLMLAVAELVASAIKGYSGAWIECKPLAFTVHYRQVSRDDVPFLMQTLASTLSRFAGTVIFQESSMALEVLPDVGWTKRDAVELFVKRQDSLPLYAGNDGNDAEAMAAALRYGGVTIGVGPHAPTNSQYHLPDVESFSESLARLLAFLNKSRPC